MYTAQLSANFGGNPMEAVARMLGLRDETCFLLMGLLMAMCAAMFASVDLLPLVGPMLPYKMQKHPLCTSADCDMDQCATLLRAGQAALVAAAVGDSMPEMRAMAVVFACVCVLKYCLKATKMGNCQRGKMYKPVKGGATPMKKMMMKMKSMKRK